MARQKKKMGCFTQFFLIFFILWAIGSLNGGGDTTTPAAPTEAPVPVDYASMPLEQAIHDISREADNYICTTRIFEVDPEVIFFDVDMKNVNTQVNMTDSIMYCIDIARNIFVRDDVPMIYIRYHEPGRDKNNNQVDMTTITMRLTKERAQTIDLNYFRQYASIKHEEFLHAINGFSLYKDYKNDLNIAIPTLDPALR